jgi:hypothetical protein
MPSRTRFVVLLCAVAACGDDGSSDDDALIDAPVMAMLDAPPPDMDIDAPPASCPVGGSVTGTVAGEGFTQVTSTIGFDGPAVELILNEDPGGACDDTNYDGQFLELQVCPLAGPGTYTIGPGLDCAGNGEAATAFFGTITDLTFATGGTVTLTTVEDGCYSGTFAAEFEGGDMMTGSFDVSLCR